MPHVTPLTSLTLPLGRQLIELHQIEFEAGGMALLRVRIREGNRFTVFDADPASVRTWAEAMLAWVATQEKAPGT